MQIKLFTRMAGPGVSYAPGSVVETDKEIAKALIAGGYAESVDEEVEEKEVPAKKSKKAVK